MRYLVGSGYIDGDNKRQLAFIWFSNLLRHASPAPSRIVIMTAKGHVCPLPAVSFLSAINLDGDLGHFMDLVHGTKPHKFNGWMGSVLALALVAYNDESDFVYLEQDCLAFGPWVEKMYGDIGDAGVLFGRKHQTAPWMPCSQSLFMVRHAYIPEFVRLILSTDAQNKEGELGEHKFERLAQDHPDQWRMMSWGYDRERPINMEDPVFYAQQLTRSELEQLSENGLLYL